MVQNQTILVVDDTKTNIDIVLGILKEYDVIPALDGESALKVLKEEPIELILLDIMMPNMDGFEICKKIKNNKLTKDIPIIFITAKTDEESIQEAFEVGGVDYITKPFKTKELLARVQTQLKLQRNRAEQIEIKKHMALNELIHNISHQWRQPLSSISTCASGMKLNKELGTLNDKSFYNSCDLIIEETMRLSSTIDEFRKLINDTSPQSLFSIRESIEKNREILLSTLLNNDINVQMMLDIDYDTSVRGTASSLIQSLLYILNNASDALALSKDEQKLVLFKVYKDDRNLFIDITDNASGIAKDNLNNIFEPYFTTKHKSHGKGLGLYVVYKTIKEMFNGKVSAQNTSFEYMGETLHGANFHIEIPLSSKVMKI